MNQVFELAGDLVPPKVAHDLMRLLAEGAGEDDEEADSLLRSSAVESYLHVLGEPKLPSVLLQVICWVLGEYGTADGTHSADDIIGRLCDVAESHPGDITVKGYSITAITKICAFEISAGRQVDLIPECRTFIEDLLASHSTDLQQRAYELQAILALSPETVANILPMDASCEDIEVDRNLSFLNEFVESAAANGARSYMPENERSGMSTVVTGTHEQLEPSAHALRFEAYEVPKPAAPPPIAAAPAALPFPDFEEQKPESSRSLRKQLAADREPDADSLNPEIVRLRLDGVQKKWGRYSQPQSSSTSTSSLDRRGDHGSDQVTQVGGGHREAVAASSIESGSVSELRQIERKKPQPEISTEKQRLAASLFGGPTASGRFSGSGGAKVSSRPGTVVQPAEKVLPPRPSSGGSKEKASDAGISKQIAAPSIPAPVDLLDMSDDNVPRVMTTAPGNDPFKQLEGLLEPVTTSSALPVPPQTASMDLMSLYDGNPAPSATGPVTTVPDLVSIAAPSSSSGASQSSTNGFPSLMDLGDLSASPFVELTGSVQGQASSKPMSQLKKGPSRQDSLQKDAASRHVGVTPTGTNPALFQDLFG
jgi:AP-4 complex subunit epsilon-1